LLNSVRFPYHLAAIAVLYFGISSTLNAESVPPHPLISGKSSASAAPQALIREVEMPDEAVIYLIPPAVTFRTTVGWDALPMVSCVYQIKNESNNVLPENLLKLLNEKIISITDQRPHHFDSKSGVEFKRSGQTVRKFFFSTAQSTDYANGAVDGRYIHVPPTLTKVLWKAVEASRLAPIASHDQSCPSFR
jgi:hypothetical protein